MRTPSSKRPLVTENTLRHGSAGYPANALRARNHNTYSDEDKARGLLVTALIGCVRGEQLLNIPKQTLSDWSHGRYINDEVKKMAKHFAKDIEKGLEQIIEAIMPEALKKLPSASFKDLMIGLGIGVEKHQLVQGLPTAIVEEAQSMTPDDRAKRIAEILKEAAERKGEGDDGGALG